MDRSGASRMAGFTLIEMMMVVLILGVLTSTAVPHFTRFTMRTRRTEAYVGLKSIYTAQQHYLAEVGEYADTFDQLGYIMWGAQKLDERTIQGRHYTFTLNAVDGGRNFQATASGDIDPSDVGLDVLLIQNQLTLVQ